MLNFLRHSLYTGQPGYKWENKPVGVSTGGVVVPGLGGGGVVGGVVPDGGVVDAVTPV